MAYIAVTPVVEPNFRAEAILAGTSLLARFTGTADFTVETHVDKFVRQVHAEACRLEATAVDVDISALEFVNSSCLRAFVIWITTVQDMGRRRYTITFLFKPAAGWQQRALDSLEMIGEDVVTTRSAEAESSRRS